MRVKDYSIQMWTTAHVTYLSFGIRSRFKFLARRKAIKRVTQGYTLPYCGRIQIDVSKITKITITEHKKK